MKSWGEKYMRRAIELAVKARKNGNHPFGAVLADDTGKILLEAENTVITSRDCSGHAELNLIREASRKYECAILAKCTIYASTEPCPMCAGAIYWANVRRVVFGLSEKVFYGTICQDSEESLYLPCEEIFKKGKKKIEVIGPILEKEAVQAHQGFWE